ncbi:MAG: hypothetical protein ACP5QW_08960 [bacterium]
MLKKTKKDKKTVLKKEHFEILLEDIQSSVKAIAEGHSVLNNKIDAVSLKLHETREELIFLIKASNESLEQRLTKKIEDGDRAVMEHVDHRFDETNQKIDEINNILKTHSEELDDHEERILRIEQKG